MIRREFLGVLALYPATVLFSQDLSEITLRVEGMV